MPGLSRLRVARKRREKCVSRSLLPARGRYAGEREISFKSCPCRKVRLDNRTLDDTWWNCPPVALLVPLVAVGTDYARFLGAKHCETPCASRSPKFARRQYWPPQRFIVIVGQNRINARLRTRCNRNRPLRCHSSVLPGRKMDLLVVNYTTSLENSKGPGM